MRTPAHVLGPHLRRPIPITCRGERVAAAATAAALAAAAVAAAATATARIATTAANISTIGTILNPYPHGRRAQRAVIEGERLRAHRGTRYVPVSCVDLNKMLRNRERSSGMQPYEQGASPSRFGFRSSQGEGRKPWDNIPTPPIFGGRGRGRAAGCAERQGRLHFALSTAVPRKRVGRQTPKKKDGRITTESFLFWFLSSGGLENIKPQRKKRRRTPRSPPPLLKTKNKKRRALNRRHQAVDSDTASKHRSHHSLRRPTPSWRSSGLPQWLAWKAGHRSHQPAPVKIYIFTMSTRPRRSKPLGKPPVNPLERQFVCSQRAIILSSYAPGNFSPRKPRRDGGSNQVAYAACDGALSRARATYGRWMLYVYHKKRKKSLRFLT